MIKAVIIDDEPNSRELLHNMLRHYCNNVEVLGEAHDVASGISIIQSKKPELVFLDIEMPGGDGFDILNNTLEQPFAVIFVTGYNRYAIKAIKYAALDYLLKPLDLNELRLAVHKAAQQGPAFDNQIRFLNKNFPEKEKNIAQIVLPDRNHYAIVELDTIIYLEAQGSYVLFHLENEESRLASYPMSHYEQLLPDDQFFRIHKSHIINIWKVEKYEKGRTGKVLLKGGATLDIAARRKSTFMQVMGEMGR